MNTKIKKTKKLPLCRRNKIIKKLKLAQLEIESFIEAKKNKKSYVKFKTINLLDDIDSVIQYNDV